MILSRLALLSALLASTAAVAQDSDPFPFLQNSHAAPAVQGDPATALAGWLRVLGDNPNDLNALEGAGRAALLCGDPSSAIGFWARADRISPNDGTIKAGLASALVQAEQPKLALQYFDRATALGVPESEIAGDRGLAFDLTGNNRRAQHDYEVALKARPDAEITRRLALSQAMSGDRGTALATLEPLLHRQDPAAWRARSFVRAITGDVPGADTDARALLPPAQAAQIAPFLARLPTLTHEQQASAVTFGDIPVGTRPAQTLDLARAATAPLPRPAVVPPPARAAVPPAANLARADGQVDFAGRSQARPATSAAPQVPPPGTSSTVRVASATPPPAARPASPPVTAAATTLPLQRPAAPVTRPAVSAPALAATTPPLQRQPAPSLAQVVPPPSAATIAPAPTAPRPTELAAAQPAPPVSLPSPETRAVAPQPQEAPAVLAAPQPETTAPALVPPAVTAASPALAQSDLPVARDREPVAPPPVRVPVTQPTARPAPPIRTAERTRPVRPAARAAGPTLGEEAVALGAALPTTSVSVIPAADAGTARGRAGSRTETTLALADVPHSATGRAGRSGRAAASDDGDAPASKTSAARGKTARDRDADETSTSAKSSRSTKVKADAAPAKKPAPERIWVQVAGGANKHDLPKAWAKLKQAAPDLYAGKSPSSMPYRFTNRLLVGPFKDADAAQDYVNKLTKGGQSGFVVRTPGGQTVEKVSTD